MFTQVEFKQANLANAASAEKAFADGPFQIVFNLVAETKYGQSEQVSALILYRIAGIFPRCKFSYELPSLIIIPYYKLSYVIECLRTAYCAFIIS